MFAKKTLVSALIAVGTLGAAALPLTSSAAGFDRFDRFDSAPARYDDGNRHFRDNQQHFRPTRFDRDGDGIPNYRDPTPDGPRWDRHGRMTDRDHDGVPDRFDRFPMNPHRS